MKFWNLLLIITVLTWKSIPIEGEKIWNILSSWEVNINRINQKLRPCRSPVEVKDVLVLGGVEGCGDFNDCIYEALNGTRVPIEAGKNIPISLSKSSPLCHCTVSSSSSKEDKFMIIRIPKDAMTSIFDSEKCKEIKDTDPGGHEVDAIGPANTNNTNDIRPKSLDTNTTADHEFDVTGQVNINHTNDTRRGQANTNNTDDIKRSQDPDTNPTGQSKETTKFKWIIMGPICGFIVLVIFSVTILAVHCRRKEKKTTKRRQTFEDIYFNSTSVRSHASLRNGRTN